MRVTVRKAVPVARNVSEYVSRGIKSFPNAKYVIGGMSEETYEMADPV